MGGIGSGTWSRSDRKLRVEESLTIAIRDFRGRIFPKSKGTFSWVWPTGGKSSVGYSITWGDDPIVTFKYRCLGGEDVLTPIRLQITPTQFGGERWWFSCPLIKGGVTCDRRIDKIHLPPGARYFGCRKCHNLTYQSCQESHRAERGTGNVDWLENMMKALIKRSGK